MGGQRQMGTSVCKKGRSREEEEVGEIQGMVAGVCCQKTKQGPVREFSQGPTLAVTIGEV